MRMIKLGLTALLFTVLAGAVFSVEEKVTVGSGNTVGIYYSTSSAVAKMFNKHRADYGQQMITVASDGSLKNINDVLQGKVNFGLAQANLLDKAVRGEGPWAGRPQKNLRAVLTLYTEEITIVAAADADIHTMDDLKGHRINIGSQGSSDALYARKMLLQAGIRPSELTIHEEPVARSQDLLENDKIDAYIFTVGHPCFAVRDVSSGKRKVRLVPLDQSLIDFIASSNVLIKAKSIPVEYYPDLENKESIKSLGIHAMLFTTEGESEETVYRMVKGVTENLDLFHRQHPVLRNLTVKDMGAETCLSLHPGAGRCFKETGLVRPIK